MEWSHGVAFWSVVWNGIKLDFGVAHLFKSVNPGNFESYCSIILLINDI